MTSNVEQGTRNSDSSRYDRDYYQWLLLTIQQLQNQEYAVVDWDNLLEELEGLAKSQKRELKSRLLVLIEHLLQLKYWGKERDYNGRGWRNTIIEQRRQIQIVLDDSPSLQPILADLFEQCYKMARQDTSQKTGLDIQVFPDSPPFSLEEVLNFYYFDAHQPESMTNY